MTPINLPIIGSPVTSCALSSASTSVPIKVNNGGGIEDMKIRRVEGEMSG